MLPPAKQTSDRRAFLGTLATGSAALAMVGAPGVLSKNAGVTPEVARAEWIAGLLPGVTLVPSGVMAVNRAQEKGCTYCSGG